MGVSRQGRSVVVGLLTAVVPGLLALAPIGGGAAGAQTPAGEGPDWVDELGGVAGQPDAQLPPLQGPPPAGSLPSGYEREPARFAFPEPTSWEVPWADAASGAPPRGGPVVVRVPDEVAGEGARPEAPAFEVSVLDRATAERAGASGFVFTLGASGGGPLTDLAPSGAVPDTADADGAADTAGTAGTGGALPVELEIDYSGFADAYGGGYDQRLRVVALPACALEEPVPEGCDTQGVPLPSRNVGAEGKLVVDVPDLTALAGDGLAVGDGEAAAAAEAAALAPVAADLAAGRGEVEADLAAEASAEPVERADLPDQLEQDPASANSEGDMTEALAESGPAAGIRGWAGSPASAATPGQPGGGGGGPAVLAVMADVSGETGNWGATPLSVAGQWSVAPGSGEFSYSYPIDVPAPAGGSAPTVGLGYSSGSIDGMTTGRNAQASQNGLGWSEFGNAFIERGYESCTQGSPIPPNPEPPFYTTDLCWKGHNGTISLNGVGGNLIPLDAQFRSWRVENDPGWRIERIGTPGAPSQGGVAAGEYWKVTAEDGTQFFFGLHYDPDTGVQTNGFWWAPVVGDHPGDPCYNTAGGGPGGCEKMAWRWNLDRVVDPDGNVTVYHYQREHGWYGALNGGVDSEYIRSGWLDHIDYGRRSGLPEALPTARVQFGTQGRCIHFDTSCDQMLPGAHLFPDMPVDLICVNSTGGPDCQHVQTPAFFSSRRYSYVLTEVWVDGTWKGVSQHNLYHDFLANEDGEEKLYLMDIQEHGVALGGWAWHPMTSFRHQGSLLSNRFDYDASNPKTRMRMYRIDRVHNPFGGVVSVTYGRQRPCNRDQWTPPMDNGQVRWDWNVSDCFPHTVTDSAGIPRAGIFHKWLVTQVVEDPRHGSDPVTTSYTYEGDPAWAYDHAGFANYEHLWAWWQWRGYGTTTITSGNTASGVQTTRIRNYRGMHDDIANVWVGSALSPTGRRSVPISTLGEAPALNGASAGFDVWHLAGRTLEQASLGTLGGQANRRLQSTVHTYDLRARGTSFSAGYIRQPTWAGVKDTTESVWSSPTAPPRQKGGTTTYSPNHAQRPPQPIEAVERGWFDNPTDDRCTLTTYAESEAAWMWNYPATNRVVGVTAAGACNPAVEVSVSETYYDGSSVLGAAPTRGNPTRQRTKIETNRWTTTDTVFDVLGRPTSVTDPRGATTETAYNASPTAWWAIPTSTTVTQETDGDDHVGTTTQVPEFGVPLTETDPNGNVTSYRYDMFGRRIAVRLPTEQGMSSDDSRSWYFEYHIDQARTAAPKVRSRHLTSQVAEGAGVRHEETWVVYDGMMRERQTQSLSPETGKVVVASTRYNARGLAAEEMAPEAVTGTLGSGILAPQAPAQWKNRTVHAYDALGRTTRETWMRENTEAHFTTTSYGADTVTVTGPTGSQVRETVDGLGRTTKVEEYTGSGSNWVASNYTYNAADNLLSVTDPEGRQTTYQYNLAGWRTAQADPHRGAGSYGYDDAGNRILTVDGNGNQIHTIYDLLGRPTQRHASSPSGPLLASWAYDAAGEKGLLDKSTRHTPSGDWVTDVTGYDDRNRALGSKLTVPASVPGLGGRDYTVTQTFDRADRGVSTTYPAVGSLAQETVTGTYTAQGLPRTLTGTSPYVRETSYDNRGRELSRVLGPPDASAPSQIWMATNRTYNNDQQLASVQTVSSKVTAGSHVTVAGHQLTYDNAGKVTERTTTMNTGSWRECYSYDARSRLTGSKVVGVSQACTEAGLTNSYSYSAGNSITSTNEVGAVTNYTYPASGQPRPYAPVTVGGVTYEWDNNGNLTERTGPGQAETFTWDVEQHLSTVSDAGGETRFVYDADGQRLLRRTPDGNTLYFAGHEVTAALDGSNIRAVRSYSFGGSIVAARGPNGVDYFATDDRGSVELAARTSQAPQTRRGYEPYGRATSQSGDPLATDRGFLSEIEDDSTALSYLNARYYDAATKQFTAPDPVYNTKQIKSLNPYTYGHGNPVSMSDASGTNPVVMHGMSIQIGLLRWQNALLGAQIGYLNSHIEALNGIIKEQNDTINELLTYVGTLEATIRQQQTIIRELADRVVYLEQQVAYWKAKAYYWYRQAQYWKGQAMYWKGQAMYWKGQAMYWKGRAMYYMAENSYLWRQIDKLIPMALPWERDQALARWAIREGIGLEGASMDFFTWQEQAEASTDYANELYHSNEWLTDETIHLNEALNVAQNTLDALPEDTWGNEYCQAVSGAGIAGGSWELAGGRLNPYVAAFLIGSELGCLVNG